MTQHTIGDNLLADIRSTIDSVRRQLRGKPEQQPEPPPRGADGIIVEIPAGGIPAAVGDVLYSAACLLFKETDNGNGSKTLVPVIGEYDEQATLPVYNPHCVDMPGGFRATTDLTKSGTRIIDELIPVCVVSSSSSGSSDSSSSDIPPPPPPSAVSTLETEVYCVDGYLQVWHRFVWLSITAGVIAKREDPWAFSHFAGCCDCPSSSSDSSASSDSSVSSGTCSGECQWVGGYVEGSLTWIGASDTCNPEGPDCRCGNLPAGSPSYVGQITYIPCGVDSSSSISPSSSSSGCGGTCIWVAVDDASSVSSVGSSESSLTGCQCTWVWNGTTWWQDGDCHEDDAYGCGNYCQRPATDGNYYGERRDASCWVSSESSGGDPSASSANPSSSGSDTTSSGSDGSSGQSSDSEAPSSESSGSSGPLCSCTWAWDLYYQLWILQPPGVCELRPGEVGVCDPTECTYPGFVGAYHGQFVTVICGSGVVASRTSRSSSATPSSSSATPSSSASATSWGPNDQNPNCWCMWTWNTYWRIWIRDVFYDPCIAEVGYTGPCAGDCPYPNAGGSYDGQRTLIYCYGP